MSFQRNSFFKVTITALVMVFVISGCSTRFVYNQLDWLVPWYLEDYVTIENYQQDEFTSALDSVLGWHRVTQLTNYADYLNAISIDLQEPVSEKQVTERILQLDDFIERLFKQFGLEFAPLIAQMNTKQQAELIENLALKNQEYNEKSVLIGQVESKALSKKRVQDFLEDWLNDLNVSQKQMLDQWSLDIDWLAPDFYQNRQAWQNRLQSIFTKKESNKTKKVGEMFKNRRQFWSDDLKQKFIHNQQITIIFITNLLNSLDSNQKQALQKKLKQYEADFRLLASQSQ